MAEVISSLTTALALARRLRDVAKNIENAEFKNALADLMSEIADAKIEAAQARETIAKLMGENAELRAALEAAKAPPAAPPSDTQFGLYKFEGVEGLHCTACWDVRQQRCRAARINRSLYRCPACKAEYGPGSA